MQSKSSSYIFSLPSLHCVSHWCPCKVSWFSEMTHWKIFHVVNIKAGNFRWIYFPSCQICVSWTYINVFSRPRTTGVTAVHGDLDLHFREDAVSPSQCETGLLVENGLAHSWELDHKYFMMIPWVFGFHPMTDICQTFFLKQISSFSVIQPFQLFLYCCCTNRGLPPLRCWDTHII